VVCPPGEPVVWLPGELVIWSPNNPVAWSSGDSLDKYLDNPWRVLVVKLFYWSLGEPAPTLL
jgi:hypothetical protein